ncbi:hypothetical protein TUSST3_17220 [Streptomyces sp. TUS-ST3]|nr:hypothetical protein TUSST3_17220 [Streptomyces sp. TUS-ST3]
MEADPDRLGPVGLTCDAPGVEDVGAPEVGVPEPPSDGPPDDPPHATRTTTPTVTHPPAHHRIRAPPGPASTHTRMPHGASRAKVDACRPWHRLLPVGHWA